MFMRRFTIYVLWEVAKLFLIALTAFTSLIMVLLVAEKLISERVSLLAILGLVPYVLPMSMQYALPATLLFAVCSVFGRIAADNEVVAIKAAGVSPMRVMAPTLVVGFLFSPFAVWMMDLAVSWGRPGMERVIMQQIEDVVYHTLRSTGSYTSSGGFSILVDSVQGHDLINPEITIQGGNEGPINVSACVGQLSLIPELEVLRVTLKDAVLNVGTSTECRFPEPFSHDISLAQAARKGRDLGRPADIPLRQISSQAIKERETIRKTDELLAARAMMGLAVGRYDWLCCADVIKAKNQLYIARERLARLNTEPWRRWASGFSCFCFVWLGVPLAIWCRTADYWSSFGVAFLPLLVVYYPLFALGLEQAKGGGWPPYSVWLGNLALLVVGAYFMRKVQVN